MKVWVVIVPQDYQSAEIVGVFYSRAIALREKRNRIDEGGRDANIQVQECDVR